MEYIHGITAHDSIGHVTPHLVAPVCESVLQALESLHWNCIIHRDLKGVNIMISSQTREIKLIDLGLSADERDSLCVNVDPSL